MRDLTRALGGVVFAIGAAVAAAADPARLSEAEQLRHRLLLTETALEQALSQAAGCRAQLRSFQLTAAESALVTDVEKQHPGYRFDPKTGGLTTKAENGQGR